MSLSRELMRQLSGFMAQGLPMVCCRLVETRGSTPQKAGAMMLVFGQGTQLGTLGGGCVEAEVKRLAIAALERNAAEVVRFQLDDDYGWDDGLICGGRMQVLLDPFGDSTDGNYFSNLVRIVDAGQGATEAIVFDSAPCALPAAPREPAGLPDVLHEHLRPVRSRPAPYTHAGIAFLPLLPRCRLIVVGGGHVGKAVADLAADLEFDVWVVDDRDEYVSGERFPHAQRRLAGRMGDILPALEIDSQTYCLIVTRGHNHDEEALYHLAGRGAAYVGMIGSRRKIKLIFDDLLATGVSTETLQTVHAPVGLDIGSRTVPEIAISIAAELVAHRSGAKGGEEREAKREG
jgi:xanthine dehydrogenase accessory factor